MKRIDFSLVLEAKDFSVDRRLLVLSTGKKRNLFCVDFENTVLWQVEPFTDDVRELRYSGIESIKDCHALVSTYGDVWRVVDLTNGKIIRSYQSIMGSPPDDW